MEPEVIFNREYGVDGLYELIDDLAPYTKPYEEAGTYRVVVTWVPEEE
jgi:hypothetical protein